MFSSDIGHLRSASLLAVILLAASGSLHAFEIPLLLEENQGYVRRSEVVTLGVPLSRGAVTDVAPLKVLDPNGDPVLAQFEVLSTWPDGSLKWVLVDFLADCPSQGRRQYQLTSRGERSDASPLSVSQAENSVTVQTGPLRCVLNPHHFDLFGSIYLDHDGDGEFSDDERITHPQVSPGILVQDTAERRFSSRWGKVESFEVESRGPLRATVAVKGSLADEAGESGFLHYTLRLHFYAHSGLVRTFFTLENPEPTVPLTGNHWVMGCPGSRFFDDASLLTQLSFDGPIQLSLGDGPEDLLDRVVLIKVGGIYQDSSGGKNWFHRIHTDHRGGIPLRFQGARAFLGDAEPYARKRPDAWLHVADRRFGLAVAVRHFWQNFPKALSAEPDGTVRVALWPHQFSAAHELQGGEIKTHEVAFFFHTGPQGSTRTENRVATTMGSFHHPLYVRAPTEQYLAAGFFDDAPLYDSPCSSRITNATSRPPSRTKKSTW